MRDKQTRPLAGDHPIAYRIAILGRLGREWSNNFDNLNLEVAEAGNGQAITTLSGTVADQAALHGLLNQIRDLGAVLLLVERLEDGSRFLETRP